MPLPTAPIWENPENLKANDFNWDTLKDLKTLQKSIKDWKIDSAEAQVINESINEISDEAKKWLKEITTNMMLNWFKPQNEAEYNSFAALIKNSWFPALPTYSMVKEDIAKKSMNGMLWNPKNILITSEWIAYEFENGTTIPASFDQSNVWKVSTSKLDDNIKFEEEFWEKYKYAQKWYEKHWWLNNSYQIKEIKNILKNDSFNDYKITNIDWKFNQEFFNAVIDYQKDNGLKVDWLVWRETFDNMMKEFKWDFVDNKEKSREYYNIEKYNKAEKWYNKAKPDAIKKVQDALIDEWLWDTWFVEWKFNYELMQKIIEFQESTSDWLKWDWLAWYNTLKSLWLVNTKTEAKKFY